AQFSHSLSVVFCTLCRSPGSAVFPYTTLFRSCSARKCAGEAGRGISSVVSTRTILPTAWSLPPIPGVGRQPDCGPAHGKTLCSRSEEHTSELQSRENLVCRLLLEKKKYSVMLS